MAKANRIDGFAVVQRGLTVAFAADFYAGYRGSYNEPAEPDEIEVTAIYFVRRTKSGALKAGPRVPAKLADKITDSSDDMEAIGEALREASSPW